MTAVYAVALVSGFGLIVLWAAADVVARSVDGWAWIDPERRFGRAGRFVVAALAGTGMGGLSASFAGWSAAAAIAGATAGAGAMIVVAATLGPGPEA